MKFIAPVFLIVVGLLSCSCHAADQPNVLVFLMDDMGYGDCRAYNPDAKVAMPNLEALAAEGLLFTDAHSPSAVCAPTRYSVLTGNYPWRGRRENGTWLFHMASQVLPGQKTIGHLMQQAGYRTAFLGKVHLGGTVFCKTTGKPLRSMKRGYTDFDFARPIKDTPASFGFDYAWELPQGIQGPPYVAFENGRLVGDPASLKIWEEGVYGNSIIDKTGFGSADWDSSQAGPRLTEKTLAFIDRQLAANEKSGARQPFFIYYCSPSCHVPHSPPAELAGTKIKGVTGDAHLDMLFEADVTLGKIIERLKAAGELNNTLLIFTSDNGGLSRGRNSQAGPLGGHDSCAGLRGSKAQIYEGGHRVPFIAKWGDGTVDGSLIQPGTRSDAIIGLQDLYATLAELTRQNVAAEQGLDSQSFLGVLTGQADAPVRTSLLVQANNADNVGQRLMKMVREGEWKLIATKALEPVELYNLKTDLAEKNNLIAQPAQQERIERMVDELKRIMNSKRSTSNYSVAVSKPKATAAAIRSEYLFKPRSTLAMRVQSSGGGKVQRVGKQWRITGKSPLRIALVPDGKEVWDVSRYRLVGVPMLNQGAGVTTVDGRLNNGNLTSWSHHCVGFGVAPAGEPATLGFVFPVVEDRYQGPAVFSDQLAKPNGHRVHWRRFYPEDVRVFTMDIKSSTGNIDLVIDDPFLAWPANPKLDARLEQMPYLDELGQVRAVDWPGKAHDIKEVRIGLKRQLQAAAEQAKASKFGRFGGWREGPKLEATGHFRTQKVDGKWWFVDPDGLLFFSVGACLAGHDAETVINQKRLEANFFAWLPDENSYLRWVGRKRHGTQEFANFPAMNCQRAFGEKWNDRNRDGIHQRMRAWGVNTLGSWSDETLQKDGRTPYALMASIWWQAKGHRKFPSPFRAGFEDDLRKALKKFSWAKDDPYCLGIFLGNELEWPDRFTPKVFELPEDDATRQWVVDRLQQKYPTLAALNAAWKTDFADWKLVLRARPNPIPKAAREDIEPLYLEFTTAFFGKCKQAINEVLPHKLYLGCRTHRGPNVLGRGAADHVDVFSVNVYDSQVRSWQVPSDVDIPILAGEFHFGAVDRGVPSPGLSSAWDQRQRGLAFAHYLASALVDPKFVGVHWFQWLDQSAAGRKDRENHQCGFVDVTGRAYPEFVEVVSRATAAMYPARASGERSPEKILDVLIAE